MLSKLSLTGTYGPLVPLKLLRSPCQVPLVELLLRITMCPSLLMLPLPGRITVLERSPISKHLWPLLPPCAIPTSMVFPRSLFTLPLLPIPRFLAQPWPAWLSTRKKKRNTACGYDCDNSPVFVLLLFFSCMSVCMYVCQCRFSTFVPGSTVPTTCTGTSGLLQWNYVPQNAVCATPIGANTLSYTSSCSAFSTTTSNQYLQTLYYTVRVFFVIDRFQCVHT